MFKYPVCFSEPNILSLIGINLAFRTLFCTIRFNLQKKHIKIGSYFSLRIQAFVYKLT